MTQNPLPMDIRLGDLADLVKGAGPLLDGVGANGIGGAIGDVERWFTLLERGVALFNSAGKTMISLREAERGPAEPRMVNYGDNDWGPEGEAIDDDSLVGGPPPSIPAPPGYSKREAPEDQKADPPPSDPSPVDAQKAYTALLAAMVDLDKIKPGITIADALVMAREMKEMIVPRIAEEIKNLSA